MTHWDIRVPIKTCLHKLKEKILKELLNYNMCCIQLTVNHLMYSKIFVIIEFCQNMFLFYEANTYVFYLKMNEKNGYFSI